MDRIIFRKPIPLSPLTELDTSIRPPRSRWRRYGLPLASNALVAFIIIFFWPVDYGRILMCLTTIIISAWYGGLGPGLLATLLALPLVNALVFPPIGTSHLSLSEVGLLGLFATLGLFITLLEESRLRNEVALRRSSNQFKIILQGVADGITAQDETGRLVFANDAAARVVGYPSDKALINASGPEILQKFEVMDEAGQPYPLSQLPGRVALQEGRGVEKTLRFRILETGEERWSIVKASPVLDERGKAQVAINLFQDITRQKQAEALLREEHERFRVTLSSIGDGVIATDANGYVSFINPVAEELTGWQQAEALGKPIQEVFHIVNEDTHHEVENPVKRALQDGVIIGLANHTVLIAKDGTERPIDDSGAPIRHEDGSITGAVLIFRDVLERRKAEETLRASHARSVEILESLGEAFYTVDDGWRFTYVNQKAEGYWGRQREELLGKIIWEAFPQVIGTQSEAEQRRAARERRPIEFEVVSPVLKSWIRVNIYPANNGLSVYFQDIAERKQAEIERANLTLIIEQQRQRLKNILANVPGVVWEAWGKPDAASQHIDFVSDYVETLLGYSVQEWLDTPNFWLTIVDEEDRERAAAESVAIFEGTQPAISRFRWVAKDGRVIPVEAQSSVIRDENGQPLGMCGVTMDISERIQAEEALRENEARFRTVLENMPILLSVNNENRRRIVWNKEAERVTGYTAEEVIANPLIYEQMYPDADYRQYMNDVLATNRGDYRDWELKTICKDGSARYISWSNISKRFPVPDWQDWALGVDVTERRRAQDRTERLQAITAALSSAVSREQVSQICVAESLAVLGADFGGISLLSEDGTSLDLLDTGYTSHDLHVLFNQIPLDSITPLADAVRTQQAVWLVSPEAILDHYADFAQKNAGITNSSALANLPLIVDEHAIGGISFSFRKPQSFDAQERDFMLALARHCAQAMERVRLYEAEQQARTQAEEAQQRLEFLAEASVILGSSLEYENTLASVSRLAVPMIADWCVIDILQDDGTLQRLAIAHANPEKQEFAYQLQRRYHTLPVTQKHTTRKVLRDNQPWFDPEVSEDRFVAEARDEEHLRLLRALGFKSEIIVPLLAHGTALGTITLVMGESNRRYTADDLTFAEELARRAAVAVANARLYGDAQAAREAAVKAAARIVRLQAVTSGLSQSLTPGQVMNVILRIGTLAVGAGAAVIVFLNTDDAALELVQSTGFSQETLSKWLHFPLDDSSPLADAVRTRLPVWVGSTEEFQQLYSRPSDDTDRDALAVVPLIVEDRVLGAVGFSFSTSQEFSEEDRALIVSVVLQCAQALERARLYEAEQRARQEQAFLAEATALLASSLDHEITLQSVTFLAVPVLADWCSIYVLQEDGIAEQVAVAHTDPAKVEWAQELQRRYPPDPTASRGVWNVLRTGQPEIYPEITDELLIAVSRDDEHLRLMREIGFASAMMVPLTVRGRTLGALSLISAESGRHYHPSDDLSLVQELARRAAIAVENSLLYQEAQRQRILAEALHDTAVVLSSTLDLSEVLDQILANIGRVVSHDMADIMFIEHGVAAIVRSRGYVQHGLVHSEEMMLDVRLAVDTTPTLTTIVETRLPLVIPDTQLYGKWIKIPNIRSISSYLGVPILVDNEVIGFLNLNSLTPNFFTSQGERLQAFANQAAVAIRNARLHQQAQKLAALEERQRLARDLHDAVSQTLFSASVIAESVPRLWEREPDKVSPKLLQLSRLNRGALAEMRTLLLELRPAALLNSSLGDLVHQLVQAIHGRREIEISLDVTDQQSLPPDVHLALYRIIQEGLNNIIKHAQAATITIYFLSKEGHVEIRISDDGVGFEVQDRAAGLGLGMMRERAETIGANLDVSSQVGKGTEISVSWNVLPEGNGTN
jgi:PAS domain S-box-containing protein